MSASTLFLSSATALLFYRFVLSYEEPVVTPLLSPSNLARKSLQEENSSIKRNDSEFSMASDYSLGMSRSDSLADIINLSRGVDSLGEFCSSGKIAIELLKFLGSGVVVCGVCWKLLDLTAPPKKLN
jgi:hypothetical protein